MNPLIDWVEIQCPYCGENYETQIDLSAGAQRYIEDCQICCQPIDLVITVDHAGALESIDARRQDG
jgi:transcription elongation factor Elf1